MLPGKAFEHRLDLKTLVRRFGEPPYTPVNFAEAMALVLRLEGERGEEYAHAAMDDLLQYQLRALGFEAGCEIYEEASKWYS